MTSRRRAVAAEAAALALLLPAPQLAYGASIVAVRVWPAADYTRVTIESDAALVARHTLLADDPPRLVVDIDGLELSPQLRELVGKVRADDPYIAGVRVGQNQPRVVRLVVDLKQPCAPQVFTLAPVAAYGHRLVFDLYPAQERDPLLALIREKERAEREAAAGGARCAGRVDRPRRERPARPSAAAAAPRRAAVQTPAPEPPPSAERACRKVERLIIVAIDPGHGGEDPGAVGPQRPAGEGRGAGGRAATARAPQRRSPACAPC